MEPLLALVRHAARHKRESSAAETRSEAQENTNGSRPAFHPKERWLGCRGCESASGHVNILGIGYELVAIGSVHCRFCNFLEFHEILFPAVL